MTDVSNQTSTESTSSGSLTTHGTSFIDGEGLHWKSKSPDLLNLSYYDNLRIAQKFIFGGAICSLLSAVAYSIGGLMKGESITLISEILLIVPFCVEGIIGAKGIEKRKRNAVFHCLVFLGISTIENTFAAIANLIGRGFPTPIDIIWMVYGVSIICMLLFSQDGRTVYPKGYTSTSSWDKILAAYCILASLITCYGILSA